MARFQTPPVTVVQGDDAPDLVITLQQDSTGLPYNLTGKAAFAVVVEHGVPDTIIHEFPCTIEDALAGKVRITWVNDPIEFTSYLDDLEPGKRYDVQVYLERTDLPPDSLDVTVLPDHLVDFFGGQYLNTGLTQEGAPIYQRDALDTMFLSRSAYDGGGTPGECVWLLTTFSAATWDEVKAQDKALLEPNDAFTVPIWNFRQVLSVEEAASFVNAPKLDVPFIAAPDYVITTNAKEETREAYTFEGAGDFLTNGQYINSVAIPNVWQNTLNDTRLGSESREIRTFESFGWSVMSAVSGPQYHDGSGPTPDDFGWQNLAGGLPVPAVSIAPYQTATVSEDPTETPADNRGTQTVLTQIPIKVKKAYRLADES